jgi:hypothetical protein
MLIIVQELDVIKPTDVQETVNQAIDNGQVGIQSQGDVMLLYW